MITRINRRETITLVGGAAVFSRHLLLTADEVIEADELIN